MPTSLYEHAAWAEIPDQTMRPGGLSITEQVLAAGHFPPGIRFLDVGCGAGATLEYVHHKRDWIGYGVDLSLGLLTQTHQQHNKCHLGLARAEHLPFANQSMDVVSVECALSLLDCDAALREFARVLKHDGTLVISDLYARNENGLPELRRLPPGTCVQAAMSQAQIKEKIERSGMYITIWNDCSSQLKEFPVCTLVTAAAIDPFDLHIAAARAKLGFFFLHARKR